MGDTPSMKEILRLSSSDGCGATSDTPRTDALLIPVADAHTLLEELAAANAKAILYDLDQAGIDSRTREAAELVQLRADLAAKTAECDELKTALYGVKEYREKNPLGGPAKVFDAMADCVRAGDDFNAVLKEYGFATEAELAAANARIAELDDRMLNWETYGAATEWRVRAEKAEAALRELQRGEFICKRCGLRKDGEHEQADF